MREDEAKKKEQVAAVFGRAAPTYDNTGRFTHFGRRLVGAVSLVRGGRVLDIAAGWGAILFPAAEQVGSDGKVTGIDLSEPMVQATAGEIQRRGLTQAEVFCMDAEHLTFEPGSFDAVFCGFSIQYFPELAQTLFEFRRLLRPRGVLALSTWGHADPRWARMQKFRRGYGVGERMGGVRLREPADVEAVMLKSGFEPVEVWTEEMEFSFGSEDEWWEDLWSSGPRAGLEQLDSDTRARFQKEAFELLQELRSPNGFPERRQAIFARGVNP